MRSVSQARLKVSKARSHAETGRASRSPTALGLYHAEITTGRALSGLTKGESRHGEEH